MHDVFRRLSNPFAAKTSERIEQTAQRMRANIRETVLEHGGDPDTIEGLQLVNWDSWQDAVSSHEDEAFEAWLDYAPEGIRDRRKLYAKFLREWPAIRREI